MEKWKTSQEELAAIAKYLSKRGIKYKAQADAIGINEGTYSSYRNDPERYGANKLIEHHVAALREAYRQELASFGQPGALEQEISAPRQRAEEMERRLIEKDRVIENLATILANPALAERIAGEARKVRQELEEE